MKPLFKVLYRLFRLYWWLACWVPRRFTKLGLGLLAAVAVCIIMLPDTENNLAYQGFVFLLCLVLLPAGFGAFFRGRFSVERFLPRFGTVGSPLVYRVQVKNLTSKTQRGLVLLEHLADDGPSFEDWLATQRAEERRFRSFHFHQQRRRNPFRLASAPEAAVPAVAAGQRAEVEARLTPLRRGVLRLEGVMLAGADPMGLARGLVKVPLPQSVLILPKRYPLPPIALPGSMKYQQGGVALASSVGQSEEFVALRDYREGDPLRHIHWRSWARAGKPVVKEFEDEFFVRHALVLDTFTDHPQSEALEEAIAVAASFACTVRTQETLLDLLFVGPESYCFTAGRSLGGADQMLQILASVRACAEQPFMNLERLVLNHVRSVSGCICVLLAWDEARREFIEKLRAVGVPALVLVVLEPGEAAKADRGPMESDPEHFCILEVGQVEQGLARLK